MGTKEAAQLWQPGCRRLRGVRAQALSAANVVGSQSAGRSTLIRQVRLVPLTLLVSLPLFAADTGTPARVATLTIHPGEVTVLHLRPDFESTIHLPEEITSVVLGSRGDFKAEHSEGEPDYVYVKPIKPQPSQSNLLISTRSGQHVSLELINDGSAGGATPVDFLLDYKPAQSFLVSEVP